MKLFTKWKELWALLRITQIAAVVLIATIMSIAGSKILMRGQFEDAGSGLILSSRNISPYSFVLASIIAWLLLAPLLYKRRFWAVIPVSIIAPFLGSAGFIFGLLCWGGPVGLVPATGFTYVAWTFIINSEVVMLPVSAITAILIWAMLKIGCGEAV
jgi:hypothetical protein